MGTKNSKKPTVAILLSQFDLATLQDNGDICCPNCGSWTSLDEIAECSKDNDIGHCPLCKEDDENE